MIIVFNNSFCINPEHITTFYKKESDFGPKQFEIHVNSLHGGVQLKWPTMEERDEEFTRLNKIVQSMTKDFIVAKNIRINKANIKSYYLEKGLRKPDGEGGEKKIGIDHIVIIYSGAIDTETIRISEEETDGVSLNTIMTDLDNNILPINIF